MEAELSHHLGYEEGDAPPPEQSNRRNGLRSKTLRSDSGPIPIDRSRERMRMGRAGLHQGSFTMVRAATPRFSAKGDGRKSGV